ncbi:MAG: branched-chain amino acid ABC transporter permease [Betaproteobacteria bacterium]|nr:branched-chain amino acid ABC transporter permease [Betaproteobacteria bacterium]MDE2124544.1 branched-chain amino acid ABC transporter permease [Betaproteobacteria bacterium]MDE2187700.1 branched-chain amino acid ABC transporter permease [Betaproteobacteria bacterium]MDE2325133.1 branched-chain amino acid ABC transporter permease [Betaproteobacteria bacterium]
MELLAYAIIGGILYGIFFSLIGIGLNLIFGVMRIINLAHGQFIVLGGYAAWIISRHFGFNPLWGVPLSVVCAVVIGYPLYYAVVPRLQRSSDPEMLSFILFFGIGQMLEALTGLAFGADQRSLPGEALGSGNIGLFGQQFPDSWWVAAAFSLAAIVGLYLYFAHTKLGYATRAIMANRDEALATGISVNRVSVIAFVAGLALAGTAGVFLPYLLGSVSPDLGNELTTTSFAIVIIGSLGNPLGTVIGGLVFGLGTMLMQTYYSSWSNLVPYVLLLIIVLIRPTGLLGKAVRNA